MWSRGSRSRWSVPRQCLSTSLLNTHPEATPALPQPIRVPTHHPARGRLLDAGRKERRSPARWGTGRPSFLASVPRGRLTRGTEVGEEAQVSPGRDVTQPPVLGGWGRPAEGGGELGGREELTRAARSLRLAL